MARAKMARDRAARALEASNIKVAGAEEKAAVAAVEAKAAGKQASEGSAELSRVQTLDKFKAGRDAAMEERMQTTQKKIAAASVATESASARAERVEQEASAQIEA